MDMGYHQILIVLTFVLIFVLIKHLKNLFRQLKDDCMLFWFDLRNMVRSIVNFMKIISPVGDDHNEGTKGEEFHIEKQKQKELKEDKENDINMVGESSEHFCSVCLDFKGKSDMLRPSDKCNNPICIENISNHMVAQIQQLKDEYVQFRLELQRVSDMMPNLMNRTFVVDQYHSEQKKTEELHMQNQKEEDKENNVKVVDQPSECLCGICLDFKAESDIFRGGNCNDSFCNDCISNYVASKIKQNNLIIKCPIPRCSVQIKPEYLVSILPKDVIDYYWDMMFLASAKANKWPKCPKCSFYVQRTSGCEHMTCRCGCNFCYECGAKWKSGHTCKRSSVNIMFHRWKNNLKLKCKQCMKF